jgi:hypothetical protein
MMDPILTDEEIYKLLIDFLQWHSIWVYRKYVQDPFIVSWEQSHLLTNKQTKSTEYTKKCGP